MSTGPARQLVVLLAAVTLSTAACGSDTSDTSDGANPSAAASTTASASTPTPTPASLAPATSSATKPSATEDLAEFFTAASRMDADLRAAAARVNDGVDLTMVRLEPKTVDAVRAIDRRAVAQTIPAGLDDDLLRAVLLVYADLATRRAAMNRVVEYASQSSLPRSGEQAQDLIRCLANGSSPAAHFAADLARARSLAAASPPATAVAADSRDSAEVAIRAAGIDVVNFGCDSCGWPVPRPIPLPPIEWKHIALAPGSEWDGTIGTSPFTAAYRSGHWDVGLNVC